MTAYLERKPRNGDEVEFIGRGVYSDGVVTFGADVKGEVYAGVLDSVRVLAPNEPAWQVGDVVRNGADPADRRCWAYLPDTPDDCLPWVLLVSINDVGSDGTRYCERDDLPRRLTLLVRNGDAVPR